MHFYDLMNKYEPTHTNTHTHTYTIVILSIVLNVEPPLRFTVLLPFLRTATYTGELPLS